MITSRLLVSKTPRMIFNTVKLPIVKSPLRKYVASLFVIAKTKYILEGMETHIAKQIGLGKSGMICKRNSFRY